MFSGQPSPHDVVRQPLPVLLSVPEPLLPRRKVLRRCPSQPPVVLSDGRPLLERLDVRYQHDGSRIWSMTIDGRLSVESTTDLRWP